MYTDQNTENFWKNPYYLFLVKGSGWSYEKEWRLFRELDKCDERIETGGLSICLANVAPEIIKSVHFGYAYGPEIAPDVAALRRLGVKADFFTVRVNRSKNTFERVPVD